ncbi:MAG: FAD-dependent oxidoreductase, partial [Acidimicrobiales bacterium]
MNERVVVVGGGITGLAAAHEARRQGLDAVVLEAATRAGGKIDSGFVDGAELPFPVDMAADGFLARQPEVVELCHELGLGDDLVAPTGAQAFIWADGALRSIPTPSVLGVPFEPDSVAATGLISEAGVADLAARVDIEHEPLARDASVGEVMRPRVGDEVFER